MYRDTDVYISHHIVSRRNIDTLCIGVYDTAYRIQRYTAIQCIGCITTPQSFVRVPCAVPPATSPSAYVYNTHTHAAPCAANYRRNIIDKCSFHYSHPKILDSQRFRVPIECVRVIEHPLGRRTRAPERSAPQLILAPHKEQPSSLRRVAFGRRA